MINPNNKKEMSLHDLNPPDKDLNLIIHMLKIQNFYQNNKILILF